MKNTSLLSGSRVAMTALTKLDAAVSFLFDQRQTIAISPLGKANAPGYVWRRIFLKGRSEYR